MEMELITTLFPARGVIVKNRDGVATHVHTVPDWNPWMAVAIAVNVPLLVPA
jgi:hypothetical protein